MENDESIRIAKFIAASGFASRRKAEEYIFAGKVKVNEQIIKDPATKVSSKDKIEVLGRTIAGKSETKLYMFHKPAGYITTQQDEEDRPTIYEVLPVGFSNLHYIGRLDMNSEGLLLLTNDGGLKRFLELPSNKMERCYSVKVFGRINEREITSTTQLKIEGVIYNVKKLEIESLSDNNAWLKITLTEGKNREIRKIMDYFGLKIKRLVRVSYGPFSLGNLPKGDFKEIKNFEEKIGKIK